MCKQREFNFQFFGQTIFKIVKLVPGRRDKEPILQSSILAFVNFLGINFHAHFWTNFNPTKTVPFSEAGSPIKGVTRFVLLKKSTSGHEKSPKKCPTHFMFNF
jgi:hypothetical protein